MYVADESAIREAAVREFALQVAREKRFRLLIDIVLVASIIAVGAAFFLVAP